ncbi:MAG: transposase [Chlorobiaceae bacterium]
MNKRVWNTEQKLSILREAEANGITATIRKYGVYKTSFYQWKQKFAIGGVEALKSQHYQINPESQEAAERERTTENAAC